MFTKNVGLEKVWEMKRLVDGNDIMRQLDIGGPLADQGKKDVGRLVGELVSHYFLCQDSNMRFELLI